MQDADNTRIAWLFPSLERGNYWHPILSQFRQAFKQTMLYTGYWPGFSPGFEGTFPVEVVGETKYLKTGPSATGYNCRFIYASPNIVFYLLRFKPHVIFTSGFSIWTALALLLKPVFRWRVVILYDGSSPGVDHRGSKVRLYSRRIMTWFVDAFTANNHAAKDYLIEFVGARENRVFSRPYLVPQAQALLQHIESAAPVSRPLQRPIFLFVGDIIPRKGLHALLDACNLLQEKGCHDYTVLIVGDGSQRAELEDSVKTRNLTDQVMWMGWIEYGQLGAYFRYADIFVFPTLEDVWGMVVLEAMVFGKPILCSKWAGSSEMVIEGENGYLFDPHAPEELARVMYRFIENPELTVSMGQKSQQLIAQHTPQSAAQLFVEVTSSVLRN